jgi:hypothetical protein
MSCTSTKLYNSNRQFQEARASIIINDYLCSIFMYRLFYYQNNLPDFYCDYFKQNSELHNYNTRNSATKLHVNFQRTNYRKYTMFNKGVSIYGKVSMKISKISNRISLLRNK